MAKPTKPHRARRPSEQDADELPPLAYTVPVEPRAGEEPIARVPGTVRSVLGHGATAALRDPRVRA